MNSIRIDSILGGQSPTTNFAAKDQFRASLGIDPSLGLTDTVGSALPSSGLLRPVAYNPITKSIGDVVAWIKDAPKTTSTFVTDISGSAYVVDSTNTFLGALADGGSLSSGTGNGLEYYDNYVYIAKNTDIARLGPLDGDAIFDGSFWVTTLGKAALTNTSYPQSPFGAITYPNHVMHRHSDGKLYIGDVQTNQGVIHVIQTTSSGGKEGAINNGSTASKLTFGAGLWPTAIESYGANLAIALLETHVELVNPSKSMSAKLAFWDTVSTSFNSMIFVEFPDEFISAIKNIDGVLYIISGNHTGRGFRVSQYVGGYTVKEVAYFEQGFTPRAGGVEGDSRRLMFGSNSLFPDGGNQLGCVYSLGLQNAALGHRLFVTGVAATTNDSAVTALLNTSTSLQFSTPIIGTYGKTLEVRGTDYSQSPQIWQSQLYKIGQPFQIARIRIPLVQALAANMTITPTIYFDDGITSQVLTTINSTNFPNAAETGFGRVANIKIAADGTQIMRGQNNFYLDLRWTGSALATVSLPILIEYEVTPD